MELIKGQREILHPDYISFIIQYSCVNTYSLSFSATGFDKDKNFVEALNEERIMGFNGNRLHLGK